MNLLQERNQDGSVKEEHTNWKSPIEGIAQLVETYRPAESASLQKIYPVMDWRGTITKWLQSDGTTVLASREYDAFGNIIPGSSVGAWPSRFGYQGQAWIEIGSADAVQRRLLSVTRVYDPIDGSFTQKDPIVLDRVIRRSVLVLAAAAYERLPLRMQAPDLNSIFASLDELNRLPKADVEVLSQYGLAGHSLTSFVDPVGKQGVSQKGERMMGHEYDTDSVPVPPQSYYPGEKGFRGWSVRNALVCKNSLKQAKSVKVGDTTFYYVTNKDMEHVKKTLEREFCCEKEIAVILEPYNPGWLHMWRGWGPTLVDELIDRSPMKPGPRLK